MRRTFSEMKSGEVPSIEDYAVTRIDNKDEYARIDYCIAGFRSLIARLCPSIDCAALERIEKKLAARTPLTVSELNEALSLLIRCENALIKMTVEELKSAVLTEKIIFALDGLKAA